MTRYKAPLLCLLDCESLMLNEILEFDNVLGASLVMNPVDLKI